MTLIGAHSIFNTETWQSKAACRVGGPNDPTWFPEKWGRGTDAKQICASCPVQKDCLDYAMRHEERYGVWGGLNAKERWELLKQARTPRRPHPATCSCPPCNNRRRAS